MTKDDVLSELKKQVKVELDEEADKVIEMLVQRFRSELGRCKTSLIAGMIRGIEIMANENDFKQEVTFQINIKAGGDKSGTAACN